MKSNGTVRSVLLHLLLAGSFLTIPYLFTPREFERITHIFTDPHDAVIFGGLLLALAYLYVNYYVLMPRLWGRGRFLTYVIISLVWVSAAMAAPLVDHLMGHPPHGIQHLGPGGAMHRPPKPPTGLLLKHNLIFFAMAWLGTMFWYTRKRQFSLEKEKAETEAAFLRTQMNPHFMFNSLNSLYGLALRENARTTADSVMQLSDMMRFLLKDAPQDKVPLENELKFLDDYIRFQRLRLPETTSVRADLTAAAAGLTISPMLLLPFVENAFKHGVSTEQDCEILIQITVEGSVLHFRTHNTRSGEKPADREKSGFGLESTLRRLELVYGGRHSIRILENETTFEVLLKINLT